MRALWGILWVMVVCLACPPTQSVLAATIDRADWAGMVAMPSPVIVEARPFLPQCDGPLSKAIISYEERLAELVNDARQSQQELNGVALPPLKREMLLDQVAEAHCSRMATGSFLGHCDPGDTSMPQDRLVNGGYLADLAGECLVVGSFEPEQVLTALLLSPGSRSLILSSKLREIGIGLAHDPFDAADVRRDLDEDCSTDLTGSGPFYAYWTILFGVREHAVFPIVIEREAVRTDSNAVNLYLYGDGWAEEMRLKNDDGIWTSWLPFASELVWGLSDGPGSKQVSVKIRNLVFIEREASDMILSRQGVDLIFEDGFEQGNTSGWSLATIEGAAGGEGKW